MRRTLRKRMQWQKKLIAIARKIELISEQVKIGVQI